MTILQTMQYFFILGTNSTLSIAELSAVFDLDKKTKDVITAENSLILKTDARINIDQLIKKLGGTVKIGKIEAKVLKGNREKIFENIKIILRSYKRKFKFGISYYGRTKFNIKPLAMEVKKFFKKQKISCRWVTSRQKTLSSVVIKQNKLIKEGIEIVLIEDNNKELFIGQTFAVQPFKELSYRDYGRPCRDATSGMLPPKLAQIMINLSGAKTKDIILDPFCGSGTILTEAMLMGFQNLIGSDISIKAIEDTKENIEWIRKNYGLRIMNYKLYNKNAIEISKFIERNSVDKIITEPYLGPQRGNFDVIKTKKECRKASLSGLEALYSKSLAEFKKILKPNGRVVMVWPLFRVKNKKIRYISLNVRHPFQDLNGFKIINLIPDKLRQDKIIQLTKRNTIIYGRPAQKIWREIVILSS